MSNKQTAIEIFINDVNSEDGLFLRFCGQVTDVLFLFVIWGGVPLVIYLLILFCRL